jgi:hypothetical protein
MGIQGPLVVGQLGVLQVFPARHVWHFASAGGIPLYLSVGYARDTDGDIVVASPLVGQVDQLSGGFSGRKGASGVNQLLIADKVCQTVAS